MKEGKQGEEKKASCHCHQNWRPSLADCWLHCSLSPPAQTSSLVKLYTQPWFVAQLPLLSLFLALCNKHWLCYEAHRLLFGLEIVLLCIFLALLVLTKVKVRFGSLLHKLHKNECARWIFSLVVAMLRPPSHTKALRELLAIPKWLVVHIALLAVQQAGSAAGSGWNKGGRGKPPFFSRTCTLTCLCCYTCDK